MRDYVEELGNPQAIALRESACETLAEGLASTGNVLWAFGLVEHPRRAVAVAIQMAGETARGAMSLLRDGNRYGAAALVRQLVEIEYLLCLFSSDEGEPLRWSSANEDAVRNEYRPARMRQRCGDRFRASEYSIHCRVGGHPRFAGGYVLPEHLSTTSLSNSLIVAAGWVDLGQHLVAAWRWVEDILHRYGLMDVGLARSSFGRAAEAIARWHEGDACARRLTEAEALSLAQLPPDDEVTH